MAGKKIHSDCLNTIKPVRVTLDVLNSKWKLQIIIYIREGNDRYTDIQKSIPCITPKVLAKELKDLEEHRLIKRVINDSYPIKIIYE